MLGSVERGGLADVVQGGLDKKRLHYIEGGQAGNRENYINNLVRNMN